MIDVINPTTEEVVGRVPEGTAEDIDKAVVAAKAAFETWSQTTVAERVAYLQKITANLQAKQEEIAVTIAQEVGMPIPLSRFIQAGVPIVTFSMAAVNAGQTQFEETIGNSLVVREPVGVVGCITPWNYPLHQIAAKVAPALAAGCTVIVKPSEVAPLNAFILAECIDAAGLPAGVFNLVTGFGPVVGEAIASHPDVDMVSFTGSTRAGKRVSELAAQTVKRVALELGGKSANIILDDADFERAVTDGVAKCYQNSGQTCSALTRMLVPEAKMADAEKFAAKAAANFKTGDPFAEGSLLGPLVSETQFKRVRGYIKKGQEEGAKLVTGGAETPHKKGYFVEPTVFSNVRNDMTIAQEEIFRARPFDHRLQGRRRRNPYRQRLPVRPRRRRLVRRPGARQARRPPPAHRPGGDQRRRLQRQRSVRRLQAVRPRPRARQVRPRRVPRGQVAPALSHAANAIRRPFGANRTGVLLSTDMSNG